MRVIGLSGSLRSGSHNTALLRAAGALLRPPAELTLFADLRQIPPYDEDADVEPAPPAVAALRAQILSADAVLIATPEYNASVPGVLKNALDWASRPYPANALRGKPVAVIGASTGLFGAVWAQTELRKALGTAGAEVLDDELPIGLADDAFAANGTLRDPGQAHALTAITARLVDRTRSTAVAAGAPGVTPAPAGHRRDTVDARVPR